MVTNKIYLMQQFEFPSIFIKICQYHFKIISTVDGLRQRKALNTNLMIKLEICQKQPFDIIAMTPSWTFGLCCVYITQLMTHPAVYTLPFTLQLCYKPVGILQRVTKSQKVHISRHDALQKLHICEGGAHLRITFWHLLTNFEKPKKSEFWKNKKK